MGYRTTVPTVYVVGWRDLGIIKNGYSQQQRWRKFMLRGAQLVRLFEFENALDALDFEWTLDCAAAERFPAAFNHISETARTILGHDGGGYRECYQADMHCWEALLPSIATEHMPRTDGRTNGEQLLTSPGSSFSFVTRTRAYGEGVDQ
jgi:hypothetical protein